MRPIIHIGFDFNAANCSGVAALHSADSIHVFQEFVGFFDTPDIIRSIKEEFSGFKIYAYPDASGIKRSSVNAHISDIALLKEAKFRVRAKSSNPLVRDRIASVNRAFENGKLKVDTNKCPELTECLEQQVFLDNGTPDKKSGYDHMVDALGYLVHYLMPVRRNNASKSAVAG